MSQVDLGKVRLTDVELVEKIVSVNGGVRLGKDADGNPGFITTDENGADTVIPFKMGGGELEGAELLVSNPSGTKEGTAQITLEKKYKAMFALLVSVRGSATAYTIRLSMPTNTFASDQYVTQVGSTAVARYKFAFDLNMGNYNIGDVYEVSFNTNGFTGNIFVLGLF